jgi:hypothetical protein
MTSITCLIWASWLGFQGSACASAGSDAAYFHNNHLGSTAAISDASGVLAERLDYEPYGQPIQASCSIDQAPSFSGKQRDKGAGLFYFEARSRRDRPLPQATATVNTHQEPKSFSIQI